MIGYGMLYTVAVGVPILLAALLASRLLREHGRAERWVWLSALGLAFVLPVVAMATPRPVEVAPVPVVSEIETSWIGLPDVVELTAVPVVAMPASESTVELSDILLWLWVATSALLGLRWLVATIRLGRLTRRLPDELVDGVEVSLTEDLGPAVSGVVRPRILLPSWLLSMPPEQVSLVLSHEEEHIRARDPWVIAVSRFARTITPWNPIVWLLSSRLLRAVELDCDRRVLNRFPDVEAYGQTLLNVSSLDRGGPLAAAAFAESEVPLRKRILAMTTPPRAIPILGLATTLILGVVLMVGMFQIPVPTLRMEVGPEQPAATLAPVVEDDAALTAADALAQEREAAELAALLREQEAVQRRIVELEAEIRALQDAHAQAEERAGSWEDVVQRYRDLLAELEATTEANIERGAVTTELPAAAVTAATGTITGLVFHDDSRQGVRGAHMSLLTTGIGGLSNNNGRFMLLNVPVGEYQIQAELEGYETGVATVEVTPGGTATVNVQLKPSPSRADGQAVVTTGTVTGTVLDEGTSDGILGAQLSLRGTGIGSLSNVRGHFLLLGVPEGEYELSADYPGYGTLMQNVVVRAGETSRLVFRLNPTAMAVEGLGEPGGSQLRIRGGSVDFDASGPEAPLLIIDNVIIDRHAETMTEALARHRAMGLEPARIEVIKPPASITVYGEEAQHGVIQVFMKKVGEDRPVLMARPSIDGRPIFTTHSEAPEVLNLEEVRRARDAQYPAELRAQGVGGVVEVHLYVSESGEVQDIRIARSSGNLELDEAALSVAAVVRFDPALNRNRPVAVWAQLPITFTPDASDR